MNLSAQDHQTFFTGDTLKIRPEDACKLFSYYAQPKPCQFSNMGTFAMIDLEAQCYRRQDCQMKSIISLSSSSWYSDAESLEREKPSSQDQSSLPGYRSKS